MRSRVREVIGDRSGLKYSDAEIDSVINSVRKDFLRETQLYRSSVQLTFPSGVKGVQLPTYVYLIYRVEKGGKMLRRIHRNAIPSLL